MSNKPCIMIIGAPRSGTSLTSAVLSAHSNMSILDEDFHGAALRLLGTKIPGNKLCTPNQIDFHRRWQKFYKLFRLNGYLRKRLGYQFPRSRLSLIDYAKEKHLKVLCVIRDPIRSVQAISKRERVSERISCNYIEKTFSIFDRVLSETYMDAAFISFDRLISEPEQQCHKICEWLNLPYESAMLDGPILNQRYPSSGFDITKSAQSKYPESMAIAESSSLPHGRMERVIERYNDFMNIAL